MTTNRICWLLAGLVLILAVWAGNAEAETRLYLGALSKHFSSEDYNERHKLVMVEHNGFIAGYTDNSYDEDTFLLGGKLRVERADFIPHVESSVIVAATYGYRSCSKGWSDSSKDVCGMVAAQFDYTKWKHYHPSFVVTPVFAGITQAVVLCDISCRDR